MRQDHGRVTEHVVDNLHVKLPRARGFAKNFLMAIRIGLDEHNVRPHDLLGNVGVLLGEPIGSGYSDGRHRAEEVVVHGVEHEGVRVERQDTRPFREGKAVKLR